MNSRLVVAVAAASVLPVLPIVWHSGYDGSNVLLFVVLTTAVAVFAALVVARVWPAAGLSESLVRFGVVAMAVIVLMGLALGGLSLISVPGYLGATAVGVVLIGWWARAAPVVDPPRWTPVPAGIAQVALVGAVAALAIGFAAAYAPLTTYDSLSYHLFFPARWLQDHAISIIPTPFSDEAQAYAPGNGELFFLWLMAPFHGDVIARAAEFPFWVFGGVTVFAVARRLGAARVPAGYAAAMFMLARPVAEQAVGADVDLICAALFAAAIFLGLLAVDRDRPADWLLWGVAAGLTLGTKYLALVYVPVLASIPIANGWRRRALWAIPGLLVFGAPWYLRNWIVAGSPIYPSSLSIAGLTIARGAFARGAMLNTVFHAGSLRLAPAILAHAFGLALAVTGLPLALIGLTRLARRGWWPYLWFAAIPFAMAVLDWVGLPVNSDSRFYMPAVGLALVPVAFLFGRQPVLNALAHVACLATLVWLVVGVNVSFAPALPWYMEGWLDLRGLVAPSSLLVLAAIAAGFAVAAVLVSRRRWAIPMLIALVTSTGTVFALGDESWCGAWRCHRLQVTDPYIRSGLLYAWDWTADHVKDSTIAYTGTNLPYPLSGPHLSNRVVYANIDGHVSWRLHDYDRAYRAGRFEPLPPALATSSGELESVPEHPGPHDDAIRPRYERLQGFPDLWRHNLDRLGVDYIFIARLSAYEVDYQVHDHAGFPIEDQWAIAAPDTFTRVYENDDARLYAVNHRERNR
jgi:hypothetical protein